MVPIPPPIRDDDFRAICKTLQISPNTGTVVLRAELIDACFRYRDLHNFQNGKSWKSKKHPSLAKIHEMLTKIQRISAAQAEQIEDAYYYSDDDIQADLTPSWFAPLVASLRTTEKMASELLEGLPELIKPGRDPDLAFRQLISDLAKIFVSYTGKKVTTNAVGEPDDDRPATAFQLFVRACCVGFKMEIIDTLETKTHKAVIDWRRSRKNP